MGFIQNCFIFNYHYYVILLISYFNHYENSVKSNFNQYQNSVKTNFHRFMNFLKLMIIYYLNFLVGLIDLNISPVKVGGLDMPDIQLKTKVEHLKEHIIKKDKTMI